MDIAARLIGLLENVHPRFDAERRAWAIGVGCLCDLPPDHEFPDRELRHAVRTLAESGDFPVGPLAYEVDGAAIEVTDRRIVARRDLDGAPFAEGRAEVGPGPVVVVGLTRSGIAGTGPARPGDMILTDVEAAFADVALVTGALALQTGYRGLVGLAVDVVADIPGRPLQLRALDPLTGAPIPPDQREHEFHPVCSVFHTDEVALPGGGLNRPAGHRIVYQGCVAIAHEFGLATPQLMTHWERGTPPPGQVI